DEFEKQLDTYGVEDEDELWEHFAYQRMTTEFEDQFYERNIDFIRDAKKEAAENTLKFSGYLEKMTPYHVRHILVKVSASANALYNSEITEAEAKKLANVGQNLALGSETFGSLAQLYSEDTGSAEKFGDLGIMSKSTSFINEFKLGVYAYEAINNSTTLAEAKAGLGITDEMSADYVSATGSDKIGTIPYEAFLKLQDYSDVTKDDDSFIVNDNNPYFYPRNILFNKYFNRHDISVITPNSLVAGTLSADNKSVENENYVGVYNATYNGMPGFKNIPGLGIDVNGDSVVDADDKVLTTKDGKVVLAVRGGTSGDSGYQGFHFIVVERSAFDNATNNVSLSDYYTTKYPGQKDYPTYASTDPEYVEGKDNYKPTYVNFLDQQIKDYKSRAESVEGEIKGFDSNLKYFIYEKLLTTINTETGNPYIKFGEPISYVNSHGETVTIDLKNTIENWIAATRNEADYNTRESWKDTWDAYVEFLEQQNALRASGKLLSETCAIQYSSTAKTAELWAKGGACYNDK
ncbi:MAG TPA: peptidylprolyl isomerase, partial [Bacilli bacterium]|nr:peptidylprolyl isomerase [Bacilli bacterium]